jgi:hypothetical protein
MNALEVFEDEYNKVYLVPQDAFAQTLAETDIHLHSALGTGPGASAIFYGVRYAAPIMLLDNPADEMKLIFFPRGGD